MTTISMKFIRPKRLQYDAVLKEIKKVMKAEGKAQKKELGKTVRTWRGKPDFETLIDLDKGGNAVVITGATGANADKWMYLNYGTKIRWALMSSDWASKTAPNKLASGRGAGRVVLVGRKAMTQRGIAPRKGIEARNWTEIINKRRKPKFTNALVKGMKIGMSQVFSK